MVFSGESTMYDSYGLRCGHAPVAVAIMWRASLDKHTCDPSESGYYLVIWQTNTV